MLHLCFIRLGPLKVLRRPFPCLDIPVGRVMGVDDDPEAFGLAASLHFPNVKLFLRHILMTSSCREFTQIDIVEGVTETILVEGRLEMVTIPWKKLQKVVKHYLSI